MMKKGRQRVSLSSLLMQICKKSLEGSGCMKPDRRTLRLIVAIFIVFLLIYYWSNLNGLLLGILSAAVPLLVGFFIAYILNILMEFYERLYFPRSEGRAVVKSRRAVCLILAFASLFLIVAGVVVLIVPVLSSSLSLLALEIPVFWQKLVVYVESHVSPEQWAGLEVLLGDISADFNWQELFRKFTDWFMTGFGGVMGAVAAALSRAFSTTIAMLVGTIFAIYLLYNKETLSGQLDRVTKHYMSSKWHRRATYMIGVLNKSFHSFIVGQCLEAVILGVLCILDRKSTRLNSSH